jgi:hypothetical protein
VSNVRDEQAALRFGRLYFRQVSGNNQDFGYSSGLGGVVAFSRVLSDAEVLVIANTNTHERFVGVVLQDYDLNHNPREMQIGYSNLGTARSQTTRQILDARFFSGGQPTGTADVAVLSIDLPPMEVQIWVPAEW